MARKLLRLLAVAAAAALVLAGVAAGISYWQARTIVHQLQAGPKRRVVERAKAAMRPPPKHRLAPRKVEEAQGAQTILLIGSDRRFGGAGGARSDTIMLVRLDADRHRIALLSIPRDLYVPIAGHGEARINASYSWGGPALLIRTVRDVFGIRIDHFVEVDFAGFRHLIDTLGGVYVPVDQRYFNVNLHTPATNYADIDLQPGYQLLDGSQALAFARFRHTDSDFYRVARQQLVLRAAVRRLLTVTLNPLALRDRALAFAQATTSDISSLGELWWIFRVVRSVPSESYARETLHAQDFDLDGADYLEATPAELRAAVGAFYGTAAHRTAHRVGRAAARQPGAHARRAKAPRLVPAPVVPDDGEARSLLADVPPIRRCSPSGLPAGFSWPPGDAVRSYALAGHPAVVAWATAGSGRSVLWMWTTWKDPPALRDPSAAIRRRGRSYAVWTENGRIRQIAWSIGPTRVWITNTLRDELTNAQMLGLALSCVRTPGLRQRPRAA